MKPQRLGLYGGSFNPVHHGHLVLARRAFEQLRLDELWFIPCARSADGKALAPATARLRWLRMALKGEPGFRVWDGELKRGGVSRSIDTVRQLRAELGSAAKFFWLLGQDQAVRLRQWKEPEALAREIVFSVFRRSEQTVPALLSFRSRWIKGPRIDISSSEIRLRIKQKRELSGMLPEALRRDRVLRKTFR